MRRILLSGYYGQRNSGDDVFGLVACWGARRFWKSAPRLLQAAPLESPGHELPRALAGRPSFRGHHGLRAAWHAARSHAVVFAGGSLFHSPVEPLTLRDAVFRGARLGRTPVGAIGVSLGPYASPDDREAVARDLRGLAFLALRDERSHREALELSLPCTPVLAGDLAWLLPEVEPAPPPPERGARLGVVPGVVAAPQGKDPARREEALLSALARVVADGFDGGFRVVALNAGDEALARRWAQRLSELPAAVEMRDYSNDPLGVWQSLRECRAVVSVRLHGALLAAAGDVPAALVEYHSKCRDLLDDLGVPAETRLGRATHPAPELARRIEACLEAEVPVLYPNRAELRARALRNFTEVPLAHL
jgi:polysaccharide pyruvyl transferase WcaK-like protein